MSVQLSGCLKIEYEMIEYPGLVKNIDETINTLGGMTKISQALDGGTKQLDMRYHPENPFNKGLHGNSNKRSGLLISMKVRRSKKHPSKSVQYEANLLGYTTKTFTFESLCDFQYEPLIPEDERKTIGLQTVVNSIVPEPVINLEYFEHTNVPSMFMPQSFARSENVNYSMFRGDFTKETGQHDVLGLCYKSNWDNRDIVTFNMVDNFPRRAELQLVKRMKIKYVSDKEVQKVKQLFNDCPIWTRVALLYESAILSDKLKCIIPSIAYCFFNGPWRTLYVRYGYDPRKDFQSRFYQTFDFRIALSTGMAEYIRDKKSSIKKQRQVENSYKVMRDINYPYFEEDTLPRLRQCILRYCDIRIPKVQNMLEKIPTPLAGAMCNERTGWLPAGFDAQVRQVLNNTVKNLLRSRIRKGIYSEMDLYENVVQPAEVDTDLDDEDFDGDFVNDNIEDFLEDLERNVQKTN